MASLQQLSDMIKAHYSGDNDGFKTAILEIAADKAKSGDMEFAETIKNLVMVQVNMPKLLKDAPDNIIKKCSINSRKSDIVLSDKLGGTVDNIVFEFAQRSKLDKNGYHNRRKILLEGLQGIGKTLAAMVFASEMKLPFYMVKADKIIGETGAKLGAIFNTIACKTGVYLFDKISLENWNLFSEFIEQDVSESIILVEINGKNQVNTGVFDDVLRFELPTEIEIQKLFDLKLGGFMPRGYITKQVVDLAEGLSQADITKASENAVKQAILADKNEISLEVLRKILEDKKER